MPITVRRVDLRVILPLRAKYRREMDAQIIHDSHHRRGFTQPWLVRVDGEVAGYGCVAKGKPLRKGEVKEFYVLRQYRGSALPMFRALLKASRAREITAQTNDHLLTLMLFDCAHAIRSDTILFQDGHATRLKNPGVRFRRAVPGDAGRIFPHRREPVGEWVLEAHGTIVATGGLLFHYNPPYGDIFMEVAPAFRRKGYGSYLIQELKRVAYRMGSIPAARCDVTNHASRATLQRAGMIPCGRVLSGKL